MVPEAWSLKSTDSSSGSRSFLTQSPSSIVAGAFAHLNFRLILADPCRRPGCGGRHWFFRWIYWRACGYHRGLRCRFRYRLWRTSCKRGQVESWRPYFSCPFCVPHCVEELAASGGGGVTGERGTAFPYRNGEAARGWAVEVGWLRRARLRQRAVSFFDFFFRCTTRARPDVPTWPS